MIDKQTHTQSVTLYKKISLFRTVRHSHSKFTFQFACQVACHNALQITLPIACQKCVSNCAPSICKSSCTSNVYFKFTSTLYVNVSDSVFVKCLLGSRLNNANFWAYRFSAVSPILLPSKCCLAVFGFVFQFKSTAVWNRNVASSVACSVEFSLSSIRVDLELSSMHMHWVHQVSLLSRFLIHAEFPDVGVYSMLMVLHICIYQIHRMIGFGFCR